MSVRSQTASAHEVHKRGEKAATFFFLENSITMSKCIITVYNGIAIDVLVHDVKRLHVG